MSEPSVVTYRHYYRVQKYKDDPEELKNILTVGSKMFQKEYAAKYELFEKKSGL